MKSIQQRLMSPLRSSGRVDTYSFVKPFPHSLQSSIPWCLSCICIFLMARDPESNDFSGGWLSLKKIHRRADPISPCFHKVWPWLGQTLKQKRRGWGGPAESPISSVRVVHAIGGHICIQGSMHYREGSARLEVDSDLCFYQCLKCYMTSYDWSLSWYILMILKIRCSKYPWWSMKLLFPKEFKNGFLHGKSACQTSRALLNSPSLVPKQQIHLAQTIGNL